MVALLAEEEAEAAKKAATLARNQRRRKQKKAAAHASKAATDATAALFAGSLQLEAPECSICLDAVATRGTACCQPPGRRILQACAACAAQLAKCPTCQKTTVWMD